MYIISKWHSKLHNYHHKLFKSLEKFKINNEFEWGGSLHRQSTILLWIGIKHTNALNTYKITDFLWSNKLENVYKENIEFPKLSEVS